MIWQTLRGRGYSSGTSSTALRTGIIWSLAICAPLVPILDRVLPGSRFSWADAAVLPLVRRHQSPALALERIQVS